jgi:hypothetical protein
VGRLAKLPGLSEVVEVEEVAHEPWEARPPLLATSRTSSVGRLAKFPGFVDAILNGGD